MICSKFATPKTLKRLGPEEREPGLLFEIGLKRRRDSKTIRGGRGKQQLPGRQVLEVEHFKESVNRLRHAKVPIFGLDHAPVWSVTRAQLLAKPLHFGSIGFRFA